MGFDVSAYLTGWRLGRGDQLSIVQEINTAKSSQRISREGKQRISEATKLRAKQRRESRSPNGDAQPRDGRHYFQLWLQQLAERNAESLASEKPNVAA